MLAQSGGGNGPDHGARPQQKKAKRCQGQAGQCQGGSHACRSRKASYRPQLYGPAKGQGGNQARACQRARQHARAIAGHRHAYGIGAHTQAANGIRHKRCLEHEPGEVEYRARHQQRHQQGVLADKTRAFCHFMQ